MGERTQMLYTVADLNALGIFKGKIDAIALDIINKNSTSGYNMNIKMGCTPLNALNTFIPQQDMKLVYSNGNYNTVAGVNTFNLNTPFLWDGTQNLVVEICYFNTTFPGGSDEIAYLPGLATSQYISQFHPNSGCDLPNLPSGGLATGTSASAGTYRMNITFSICDIPVKTWPYRWTPGTLVFDSTVNTTTAYVEVGKTYHVYTTGGNKCEVHDSVTVTLSVHDLSVTPADTTICLGDGFNASAYGSGNAPSQNFVWFNAVNFSTNALSCVNCSSPVITPLSYADSLFACVRIDTYNCTDTQYVHVSLNPTPTVSILNGDSITIKYLQEVNLIATGAQVYNWSPVWGTGNPNVSNTIVSPQEPTTYTVYGINQFGCGTKDSIKVNVDYEDNLFVPSAFSPNGDGINDLFKVANLTFQKVQEFRVLNRWGQEVFNANDNRGWNGTFKGVDQDPGVYYYLIKLAMPNGPTKMFKGDVTIIR
jgi:gliding motility-associated-like protein